MAVIIESRISATVLGVAPSASREEIRAAYKRRVKETHPDKGGLPEDFRAVRAAYESWTRQLPEPPAYEIEKGVEVTRRRAPRQPRKSRKPPTAKTAKRELSPRALASELGFFPKRPCIEVYATL
mmetsp:Transcript_28489/g.45810  ORF Transcript_28489/g.45810 Transcript_28489/m.45810 type:complete len:125 (-) Transcript_28489:121-495(-)